MKRQLGFVCAGLPILILALSATGCGAAPTPASIPTNTPPVTLTAAPTSAPTNTSLPKPTNTTAPTNPPATTAATKAPAAATTAPTTAATKPTSAPTATTAAATKPTSAPTAPTAATTGQSGTNTSSTGAASKDMCLACHGPFDKLAVSTANYVAPSGEKGTPHRFTPHDSIATIDIPECSNCHKLHPIPPVPGAKATPADVQWCYNSCHHQNDFTPCKKCHG